MGIGAITLREWLTLVVILVGVAAMLLSSLGIMRLPDMYMRLHAASKARTLGIGALLMSIAMYDWTISTLIHILALMGLLWLTTPLSAHLLGRVAYRSGIKHSVTTRFDDLAHVAQPDADRTN